jgi:hypothetical protein
MTKAVEVAKRILTEKVRNPEGKHKDVFSLKGLKFFLGNYNNPKIFCEEVLNGNNSSEPKGKR